MSEQLTNASRPVFLLGQPLFHLTENDPELRLQAVMSPQEARMPETNSVWRRLDREVQIPIWADPPAMWRRVALVCGAGLGKTANLRYLECAINSKDSFRGKQVAFFLDVKTLSESPDKVPAKLMELLLDRLHSQYKEAGIVVPQSLEKDLIGLRNEGRVTLLLDGLDQASPVPLAALRSLHEPVWKTCPVWLSGRPHAFKQNWPFFESLVGLSWQFVRVGQLHEAECRFLLDDTRAQRKLVRQSSRSKASAPIHLYDALSPAAQRLAAIPRTGKLIGRMSPKFVKDRLSGNATAADVYWEIYSFIPSSGSEDCGILLSGLRATGASKLAVRDNAKTIERHQVNRACDLLGAAAFEMLAQRTPAFNGIPAEELFEGVFRRFLEAKALVSLSGDLETTDIDEFNERFLNDWKALLDMDSHGLNNFIFSSSQRDEVLRWSDITTMAFFAAYWACHWATPEELEKTRQWIIDPLTGDNEQFREFWSFALEMPDRHKAVNHDRWVRLFAPLYDGSLQSTKPPIRSTEFICRGWERMKKWSAEQVPRSSELPLQAFLRKYRDIHDGAYGAVQQRICDKIESKQNWCNIPAGICYYGADPLANKHGEKRKVEEIRLHKWPVTNEMYELFDPRHRDYRWRDKPHPLAGNSGDGDDSCPVVKVTWYDAWCFATWCGSRLPKDVEWEHAVRGVKDDPKGLKPLIGAWFFGNEVKDLSTYAHYGHKNWKTGSTDTVPVNKRRRRANPFGLYDMLGQVWEWCQDCEGATNSFRAVRGGSWYAGPEFCRSAWRNWFPLGKRLTDLGFRLAQDEPGTT